MVVRLGPVTILTDNIRLGEAFVHIAEVLDQLDAGVVLDPFMNDRRPGLHGLFGVEYCRQYLVFYVDQAEGFLGGILVNGGYSSYAVTGMTDLVDAQGILVGGEGYDSVLDGQDVLRRQYGLDAL